MFCEVAVGQNCRFSYPAIVQALNTRHHLDTTVRGRLQANTTCHSVRHVWLRTSGVAVLGLSALFVGCQADSRQAALESQLRGSEATIRQLENELDENKQLLAEQDRELAVARSRFEGRGGGVATRAGKVSTVGFTDEQQVAFGSVASLQIHKLTSGIIPSVDRNGSRLNVVLQPLDGEGELVKVAGQLTVNASVVAADGNSKELIQRKYSITEGRQIWVRNLVSSGFHVTLELPSEASGLTAAADKLLVTAALQLSPDRVYRTSELLPLE